MSFESMRDLMTMQRHCATAQTPPSARWRARSRVGPDARAAARVDAAAVVEVVVGRGVDVVTEA